VILFAPLYSRRAGSTFSLHYVLYTVASQAISFSTPNARRQPAAARRLFSSLLSQQISGLHNATPLPIQRRQRYRVYQPPTMNAAEGRPLAAKVYGRAAAQVFF